MYCMAMAKYSHLLCDGCTDILQHLQWSGTILKPPLTGEFKNLDYLVTVPPIKVSDMFGKHIWLWKIRATAKMFSCSGFYLL